MPTASPPAGDHTDHPDRRVRVVEVDIPSDVRFIENVVELVRRECQAMAFTHRQIMLNVPVALTEAISNAILRGNRDDPAKNVHVRAQVDTEQLVVEIGDEGRGFDLDARRPSIPPRRRISSARTAAGCFSCDA